MVAAAAEEEGSQQQAWLGAAEVEVDVEAEVQDLIDDDHRQDSHNEKMAVAVYLA